MKKQCKVCLKHKKKKHFKNHAWLSNVRKCVVCTSNEAKATQLDRLPAPIDVDLSDVGYLYVIMDVRHNTKWFKVGKTINPKERLATYNKSFPEDVMLYRYLSCKLYNLSHCERELVASLNANKKFVKSSSRREWFKRSMAAGTYGGNSATSIIKKIEDEWFEI